MRRPSHPNPAFPLHSIAVWVEECHRDFPTSHRHYIILGHEEDRIGVPGRRCHLFKNCDKTLYAHRGGSVATADGGSDTEAGEVRFL